jgi:uncharacterized membrane protein
MSRRRPDQPRQRRYDPLLALRYIIRYQREHGGLSPSQRRIQRDLGISAPSIVHRLLHRLAHCELLLIVTHGRGFAAELIVTEAGRAAAQQWQAAQAADAGDAEQM